MKKQFLRNLSLSVRNTTLRFGLIALVAITCLPTFVQAQIVKTIAETIAIQYVGNVDNQPVFQIEFENKEQKPVQVSIKDEDGNTLYFEKIKDKKFSRKFKFERLDAEDMKLTFTLTTEKEKHVQVFEVNTSVRTVQDVVVTKL